MHENALVELGLIVLLGIGAQWLGWRLRLPAIIFLLTAGIVAGPTFHLLNPDALFGSLLAPFVSFSIAIILFEGGLTLKFSELPVIGGVASRLVTLGVLITWGMTAVAAHFVLGLGWAESTLLGAILSVTGPTVIGPLLRHVRPTGSIAPILKWEGIMIDPVGASLATLVFTAIVVSLEGGAVGSAAALIVARTILIGVGLGALAASGLLYFMRRYWIPDNLQIAVSLATVLGAFTLSNVMQEESGLLTVTLMGILMANQKSVSVRHLIEFKENLRVLLLSTLFVVLSARLDFTLLEGIGWSAGLFVLLLMFVVRPVSVLACTLGSSLRWQERVFLSWMAPRGIVAAAISSVFALLLSDAGFEQAEQLVPITFLVIASTVLVYGLTATHLARALGVSNPDPDGTVIIGAHPLACALGEALQNDGFEVLLIDSNWGLVTAARQRGLKAHYGDALGDSLLDGLQLDAMGRMLAMTANDNINALASLHFAEVFGRTHVYQLASDRDNQKPGVEVERPLHLRGRILFRESISYDSLTSMIHRGAVVKKTKLTDDFTFDDFKQQHGEDAIPLFLITEGGRIWVNTPEEEATPQPGQKVVFLTTST